MYRADTQAQGETQWMRLSSDRGERYPQQKCRIARSTRSGLHERRIYNDNKLHDGRRAYTNNPIHNLYTQR